MVAAEVVFEQEVVEEANEEVEIEEVQMKRSSIGRFSATTVENQVIKKLTVVKNKMMRVTKQALKRKMMMNVSFSWPFLVKKRLPMMFCFWTMDVSIIYLGQNHSSRSLMSQKNQM